MSRTVGTTSEPLSFTAVGPRSAATCVLLHGVGTSGWMWRALIDDLSKDFHVLTPDLPGHGASNRRPWRSMADTVAAVAALISGHAQNGSAHVVGLSLGGYVGLDLAAAHPDVVPSATVSGVNVLPFPRPRLMRAAGRALSPLMTTGVMLRANARALGVPPEDFAGYAEAAKSMAPRTFLAVGEELMTYSVPAAAAHSTTRVLALAGSHEQPLIRKSLSLIAAAFPQGAARLVPEVGHAWNGQLPDLFAATVRAHISGSALPEQLAS